MLIDEVFRRVLVKAGQFLIRPDNIELKRDDFAAEVEDCLCTFSRYHPATRKFNRTSTDKKIIFVEFDPKTIDGRIPCWISSVTPLAGGSGCWPETLLRCGTSQYSRGNNYDLSDPKFAPWEFRNNTIYVPWDGDYDIQAVYKHNLVKTQEQGKFEYCLPTIEHCNGVDVFFELVAGKTMQILANVRDAFTIEEIQIRPNADVLRSEGIRKEEKALETLKEEINCFYLAWKGG